MTYLQAINAVLSRLRETTAATSTDTAYVSMIGTLVNEAKQEVEDAWNWTALRQEIEVTTAAGTQQYAVTGAGDRFRVLQVINDTDDVIMRIVPSNYMGRLNRIGTTQQADPTYYRFRGVDSSGDPYVDFWPIPNGTKSIQFDMVVPQAALTADATVIKVPSHPVVLGAFARALSERGEDGATAYAEAWNSYQRALSDAISRDIRHTPGELDWYVM